MVFGKTPDFYDRGLSPVLKAPRPHRRFGEHPDNRMMGKTDGNSTVTSRSSYEDHIPLCDTLSYWYEL